MCVGNHRGAPLMHGGMPCCINGLMHQSRWKDMAIEEWPHAAREQLARVRRIPTSWRRWRGAEGLGLMDGAATLLRTEDVACPCT